MYGAVRGPCSTSHFNSRITSSFVPVGRVRVTEAPATGPNGGPRVHSIEPDGTGLAILVKATAGPATTPFFLDESELALLNSAGSNARIYRIYDWNGRSPMVDFFIIESPFLAIGLLYNITNRS